MSQHHMGLAGILAHGGQDFAFTVSDGRATPRWSRLDGVIGALQRDRQLLFVWWTQGKRYELAIEPVYDGPRSAQHELFRLCELHPDRIWMASLQSGQMAGTLIPFTPPHTSVLAAAIPLFVPGDLRERASHLGIRIGEDARRPLQLRLPKREVLIVGQRGLAAESEEDGRRLTLWLSSGDALEVVLEKKNDGARLFLTDIVFDVDASRAHSGPNMIIDIREGAEIHAVDAEDSWGAASVADSFLFKQSLLLRTWVRYSQLEHELSEARLQARLLEPLLYTNARQHHKDWRVTIAMTGEQRKAWLGADPESRHEVRVDQQVELSQSSVDQSGEGHQRLLMVLKMRREGAGVVTATLQPKRGVRHIPKCGQLRAVENIGSKVEQSRRREALVLFQSGRAACSNLMNLLIEPSSADAPLSVKFRPTHLDDSQRRALEKILGCRDLVAIQGPPGTGKTSVIVEALLNLAERRKKGQPLRVLVSSVQNEAIDNVAERLAREGILIHQIRRESQDEDEAFQQALQQDQTRTDLLQKLAKSLEGKPVLAVLRALRESLIDIDRLRATLADDYAIQQLADELCRFLASTDLPTPLRDRGHRLIVELRKQPLHAPQTAPATPQNDQPPGSAESTLAWWESRKELWPTSTRASVEAAAQKVILATEQAQKNPLRYGDRKARAFAELLGILQRVEKPPLQEPEASPVPIANPVEDWLTQAEQELRLREKELLRHPEVVAQRFLERVKEDPSSWRQVQRRHSQTTTATCSMSAKARDLAADPYELVIIDEAGRATPLELLVPMVQGKRVVLIGDHRQLPPLVEDEVISALEQNQPSVVKLDEETLFGELFNCLPRDNLERLSVQYRMHEHIGQMVCRLFYKPHGEVLRSHFSGDRARDRLPSYGVLDNQPVTFIDTEDRPGSSPYENQEERRVVLALLSAFAESPSVRRLESPVRLGVICAYARQRELLLEEFDALCKKRSESWDQSGLQVEIKTIDAVQGREYPVTIVCLVRRDGLPGFLAAPNRINVALSRAQRQLIILGTRDSLTSAKMSEGAPHMPRLVAYCQELRRIKPWSEVRL